MLRPAPSRNQLPRLKLTTNATWLFGCRLGGDLLNLLLFVVISRNLGPAGMGAYAYGFAVATFVFVIGSIGIEEYGLRQYARLTGEQRRPFLAELLGTQLVMTAVAVAGLVVYLALTAPSPATLVTVISLSVYQVAVGLAGTLFIPAMADQRMAGPAVIDLVCRALAMVYAVAAILVWQAPIAPAAFGYVVAGALLIVLAARSATRHGAALAVKISRAAAQRVAGALWSFAASEVMAQLFSRVGVIALTLMLGEAAAGLFATGLRLIEMALTPLSMIGIAAYPRLSQLYVTDLAEFRRSGSALTWLMLALAGGLAWGLYFVSPVLLVPVFGQKYAGSEAIVQTMAAVAVVQAVEVVFGRLLLAADRQVARAAAVAAGALLSLALNMALVPRLGVDGAICASVVSYAVIDVAYGFFARQPMTGTIVAHVLATLVAGIGVGVAAAVTATAGSAWSWAPAGAFLTAFAAVAALGYRHFQTALVPALIAPQPPRA